MMNLRIESIICHLSYPAGKPENFRFSVAKGSQYFKYGFALDALTQKPSGFCNVRGTFSGLSGCSAGVTGYPDKPIIPNKVL